MPKNARSSLACAFLAATAAGSAAIPPTAVALDRPTVAVLYFDYQGQAGELGVLRKGLAQMLITDLSSNPAFQIVERGRLEALLEEQKLGASGKIDPTSAARLGRLLGARYMVLGGYFELGQILRVDARLVEVETGRVLGSSGTNGKPGDVLAVEQATARELERLLVGLGARAVATPAPRMPAVKPPAKLSTPTAVLYAKALDDLDRGDRSGAREKLGRVVKEQPDFTLASLDLGRLGPM